MMQQPQSGGMMSGLMGTMASGMAFGAGSAVAHKAVDAAANSLFGGDKPAASASAPAPVMGGPCSLEHQSFLKCLERNNNDASACSSFFENLSACQRDAKAFS